MLTPSKTFVFLGALLLAPAYLFSQVSDICIQVIGANGNYGTHESLTYSYTVGEVAIQTLDASDQGTILTQGFHQPECGLIVNTHSFVNDPGWSLKLYPNPTKAVLNLEIGEELLDLDLQLTLFDQQGKLLPIYKNNLPATSIQIDCQQLPAGQYLLRLSDLTSGKFSTLPFVKVE